MKQDVVIGLLEELDYEEVADLEKECFSDPWPLGQIKYEKESNPCAVVLTAKDEEGKVIGYLDFMITFDSAAISRLCVSHPYRHKGVASALLRKMDEILLSQKEKVDFITLEVRLSNLAAIGLYQKLGYQKVTIKPKYYNDGEDALYMVRSRL